MILFLFLTHLGLGIAFTLALVSREAGVKFFRFNAGLAAILIAVAFAFRPGEVADPGTRAASLAQVAFYGLAVSEAAIVLYWATVGRTLASVRPAIVAVVGVAGVVAIVSQALALVASRAGTMQLMTVASFLSSAVLLGGACTAMILGHWYLVIPSMQVSHLQSMVKVHMVSMAVRIAVVVAAIVLAVGTWQPGLGPSFRHYIGTIESVFFWQRVAFGLAGPALLAWMTWETAKIRSTQSATGILYVDFFMVVVGEVLAKWVLLDKGVPV